MRTKGRWQLDAREVTWKEMGTTSTHRSKLRLTRSLDLRGTQMTAEHIPTGLSVTGAIPQGNYSRPVLRSMRDKLRAQLFAELEGRVARQLRVSGR